MTDKVINICLSCGQIKRPQLYLNDIEKREFDRLLSLGDWRAWAKKVLEHSEPTKLAVRKLIHQTVSGTIEPEEFARQYKELDAMPKED